MLYLLLFILGASLGSFLNVIVYRLPLAMPIARGRSLCPHCSLRLKWFDLVPLLSFILLAGHCRNCKAKIAWSYFLVELTSGFLALLLWLVFAPNLWLFIFWLSVAYFLLALLLFDLKYLILPDKILVWLISTAVAIDLLYRLFENKSIIDYGTGLVGAAVISGFFLTIWLVSRGRWIGFGDVKLGLAIGLIFGLLHGAFIVYLSAILGGVLAVILLVTGKANMKTKLPLGSFIALSGILYLLLQQPINVFLNKLI